MPPHSYHDVRFTLLRLYVGLRASVQLHLFLAYPTR